MDEDAYRAAFLEGFDRRDVIVPPRIIGEINLYTGGITWFDADEDERFPVNPDGTP